MKVADHLSKEQNNQLSKPSKNKRRNKEKLSRKDIEELMNINMPTYYKKNGAWHSK